MHAHATNVLAMVQLPSQYECMGTKLNATSQDGAAAVIDCTATQVNSVSAQLLRQVCWQLSY